MVRQCDKGLFARRVVYVVFQSLLPIVSLRVLKALIDAVTATIESGTASTELPALIVTFVGLFFMQRVFSILTSVNGDIMAQKLIDNISDKVQSQAATLDMSYYDSPSYHDTLQRAQQEISARPIQVVTNGMNLVGALISMIGIAAIVGSQSWLLLVIIVAATVPTAIIRFVKAHRIYTFRRSSTQTLRRTNYFGMLLTQKPSAAEIRTLRLSSFFRRQFVESRSKIVAQLLAISRRLGWADGISALFEAAALVAVFAVMLGQTTAGLMSVGSFVMVFEAVRRGMSYLQTAATSASGLYDNRLFIGNLFEFLDLKPLITNSEDPIPFPSQVEEIEFCDVSFRYPDMERNVLSHFNFHARKGEITRLDGENGSGKTTAVKLLLRLYDPDEGVVKVNGRDLGRINIEQLRSSIGVMFQEFMRYNCTVTENIAFGAIHRPVDMTSVVAAATAAGIDKVIENLPDGYNTMLGRMFEGGAELSMGQWQRLALARLLYANTQIMILDEPTAWIDHRSRENFNNLLESLKENKIIILITHTQ